MSTEPPVVLHGVDVVSIDRIADLRAEFGESFLQRSFTRQEREYCERQGTPAEHYAARWAAKEAFLKTVGERADDVPASTVGVVHDGARPRLSLSASAESALHGALDDRGRTPETASRSLSLSHDRDIGVAVASLTVVAAPQRDRREQYD